MEPLTAQLALTIAPLPPSTAGTRRSNGTTSTIDYVLTNRPCIVTEAVLPPHETLLDHLPLVTVSFLFQSDWAKNNPRSQKRKTLTLKKDLTNDQILNIMRDPAWPKRPFVLVAYRHGLAQIRTIKSRRPNETETQLQLTATLVRDLLNQASQLTQDLPDEANII